MAPEDDMTTVAVFTLTHRHSLVSDSRGQRMVLVRSDQCRCRFHALTGLVEINNTLRMA